MRRVTFRQLRLVPGNLGLTVSLQASNLYIFTMASVNAHVARLLLLLVALPCFATPRDIIFPPVAGTNTYQSSIGMPLDDVDIVTGSQFSGINTFAHLPYVYCFDERSDTPKYDITFLGAPFDTVGAIKSLRRLDFLP